MAPPLVVGDDRAAHRVLPDEGGVALRPAARPLHPLLHRPARQEGHLAPQHLRRERAQRREVVHDPDAAAVRGDDQVVLARMDQQIPHRDAGEVAALELRPALARVGRDPQPELGPAEEQARLHRVFLDDLGVAAHALLRADDARPALAEVRRAIDPRRHVAEGVAVESRIGGGRVEAARLDPAHPGSRRQIPPRGEVAPVLAAVARELHAPVVGAHPDEALVLGRLADRVDAGVHLRRGVVDGDAARLLLLLLRSVVAGQVRRDALPVVAPVAGAEEQLRADVERRLVGGAARDGRVPVEAQLLLVERLRLQLADGAQVAIDAADVAALRLGVHGIGIAGVGHGPESVPAEEVLPAAVGDAALVLGIAHPRAVVLEPSVDLVRVLVVDGHMIKLRDGKVGRLPPAAAAVERDPQTAVVAAHDVLGVVGVDPQVVPVAVRAAAAGGEAAPAVIAGDELEVGLEEPVGVLRIDDQPREVERPPHHALAAVAGFPGRAAVRGAVQRRAGRLDEGVDDVAVGGSDRYLDPAPRLGGQALLAELGPAAAAVGGAEEAAAAGRVGPLAAGAEGPALAAEVPQPGDEDARIERVHRHGGAAGGEVRAGEDQVPALASVVGLVESAVGAVAPELAGHAGVDHVGVLRVYRDGDDALGVAQAHVGPALAAVGRLVDAVADGHGVAHPGLARAHPDGLGVRGIDGDGADRLHRLLVEDRPESGAAVHRLPHAARGSADIEGRLAVLVVAGDCGDAAAHRGRADVARPEPGDDSGVEHRRTRCGRRGRARGDGRGRPGDDGPLDGRARRGKAEERVVHLDVRLCPLHRVARRLRPSFVAGLPRERHPDPCHLFVAAQIGLGNLLRPAHVALVDDADLEESVLVEKDVLHVAVL